MIVIGLDCGTATTGWAIIKIDKNGIYKEINYGVIQTSAKEMMEERLKIIFEKINELISKFNPTDVAIEDLFYFKNQKTVITVGQARGVMVLASKLAGKSIYNYTPLQVKSAVCGYGKADKIQVSKMVKAILKLKEIPKPDDAADALAIAICHINTKKNDRLLRRKN